MTCRQEDAVSRVQGDGQMDRGQMGQGTGLQDIYRVGTDQEGSVGFLPLVMGGEVDQPLPGPGEGLRPESRSDGMTAPCGKIQWTISDVHCPVGRQLKMTNEAVIIMRFNYNEVYCPRVFSDLSSDVVLTVLLPRVHSSMLL